MNPPHFQQGKALVAVLALIAGLIVAWLFIKTKPEKAAPQIEEKAAAVSVMQAQPQSLPPMLRLYGELETPSATQLASRLTADVRAVPVVEGDDVSKGQLLVRLDDADMQLRHRRAQADLAAERARHQADLKALEQEKQLLALARKAADRAQQLYDENLTSESVVDEAQERVQSRQLAVTQRELAIAQHDSRQAQIRANLDEAELNLSRTRIRAPFAGRVSAVLVAPGDAVNPGQPLVAIYDPSKLEIRAAIPSDWLPRIQATLNSDDKAKATVTTSAASYPASLHRLSGRTQSGNIDGFFRLNNSQAQLRSGQTVTVWLSLPVENNVVPVPPAALYGRNRLYLFDDGRMRGIDVQRLGEWRNEAGESFVLVRHPELTPETTIVISQVANPLDGLKLKTLNGTEQSDDQTDEAVN